MEGSGTASLSHCKVSNILPGVCRVFGEERCDAKHNVGRLQIVGYAVPVRHDGAVAHVGFGQGDGNLRWGLVRWIVFNGQSSTRFAMMFGFAMTIGQNFIANRVETNFQISSNFRNHLVLTKRHRKAPNVIAKPKTSEQTNF